MYNVSWIQTLRSKSIKVHLESSNMNSKCGLLQNGDLTRNAELRAHYLTIVLSVALIRARSHSTNHI